MPLFVATVEIHLKPGALDPQGQAVGAALLSMGHAGLRQVRVGKHVRLQLEAPDGAAAEAAVRRMCEELLVSPVMETGRIGLQAAGAG